MLFFLGGVVLTTLRDLLAKATYWLDKAFSVLHGIDTGGLHSNEEGGIKDGLTLAGYDPPHPHAVLSLPDGSMSFIISFVFFYSK